MTFTRITTAGAGTMGSQVAWQMAFHGKQVTVYDAIPEGLEKGKELHREYAEHFVERRGASREEIGDTFNRLAYTTDLATAVADADLISESVPEALSIKESFGKRRPAMPRPGPCSRPTRPPWRRAGWPASSTARKGSWPCTSR